MYRIQRSKRKELVSVVKVFFRISKLPLREKMAILMVFYRANIYWNFLGYVKKRRDTSLFRLTLSGAITW